MRRFGISVAALFSTLLTLGATAHAEVEAGSDNVPPVSGQPMGKVAVRRGVQGPGGLFTARVLLLVNASKDSFGKPTSLAPDLFYSVSDTVQIGLLHTGPMGWQSRPGFGLCLTGTSDGCPKVYNNVGFDFMYGLLFGDFHLSLHSSLFLLSDLRSHRGHVDHRSDRQVPLHRRGRAVLRSTGGRDAGAPGPLQGAAVHSPRAPVPDDGGAFP